MERRSSTLLFVALLCTFVPSALCGFVWDDHRLIVNNAYLRDPGSIVHSLTAPFWSVSDHGGALYFRPVVSVAYLMQFQAFGLTAAGYHLVSVALHLLCVGLAIGWLRRRLPPARGISLAIVLGVAAFALHPTRPESVTWIAGSTELWAAFFMLGSALSAHSHLRVLAALLGALALFSKETAVALPVLLAAEAFLLSDNPAARRRALQTAGVVAGTMALALMARRLVLPIPGPTGSPAVALSSLGHYLEATLWPWSPTVLRGELVRNAAGQLVLTPQSLALGTTLVLMVCTGAVLAYRRPALRPFVADALWFLVPLLPVVNLLPLGIPSLVAERYLYVPMLGVSAVVARLLVHPLSAPRGSTRALTSLLGAVVCLSLAVRSAGRVTSFADDRTLWEDEQARSPDRPFVLERLIMFAQQDRDHGRATQMALRGHAVARHNNDHAMEARMALLVPLTLLKSTPDTDQARLRRLRQFYDELITQPKAALALADLRLETDFSPALRLAVSHDVLFYRLPRALAYMRSLELERAAQLLQETLALSPGISDAWLQLAAVEARRLRFDQAQAALAQAHALSPENPDVRATARALSRAHAAWTQEANSQSAAAARLGRVFILLGAPELARRALDAALAEAPDDPALIAMRARCDAADGDFERARARIERAAERLPEHRPRLRQLMVELEAARSQRRLRQRP